MDGPQLAVFAHFIPFKKCFGFRETQNVLCPKDSSFSFLSDYVNIYISFRFIYTYLIKTFHRVSGWSKIKPNTLAYKSYRIPESCCRL